MKRFLIVFLLLSVQSLKAQLISDSAKVILRYARGHNSWNEKGIYSREEIFEIGRKDQAFKILRYLRINHSADTGRSPSRHDTTSVNTKNYRSIPKSELDSLFTALVTTKPNFTLPFIAAHLKKPTMAEVKAVAARLDSYRNCTEYMESAIDDMDQIRNFDKLESFITKNTPNPEYFATTVDAWDFLRITLIDNGKTTLFDGDFLQLLGQPFHSHTQKEAGSGKNYVNLEINEAIAALLPQSSSLRKEVKISDVSLRYIEWFLAGHL